MKWIDATKTPPNLSNDIIALYSEYNVYSPYQRPQVLYLAKMPYPHYYNEHGEEIKTKHISYYINIPTNPA